MIPPHLFFQELAGQPEALHRLADQYAQPELSARLAALPTAPPPLLLGMGASYHSGLVAAWGLRQRGWPTQAVEATEALNDEGGRLRQADSVLYVSQSGASGEILPVLDRLAAGAHVTALTNNGDSPLGQRAQAVLPLLAGDELTVATKTFTNSLAILWLLGRRWTDGHDPAGFDVLHAVADQMAQRLNDAPQAGAAVAGAPGRGAFVRSDRRRAAGHYRPARGHDHHGMAQGAGGQRQHRRLPARPD